MRIAAIDIGTNSFRLLVAEVDPSGDILPLCKRLVTVRLGRGLAPGGVIAADRLQAGREALASFRRELDTWQPAHLMACGTAVLRLAANRDLFLEAAAELGISVQVVDGRREAMLGMEGAFAAMGSAPAPPVLLADVGGGSTELIVAGMGAGSFEPSIESLPLGVVRLTETFGTGGVISPPAGAALAGEVRRVLAPVCQKLLADPVLRPAVLVGSGGSATAAAALDLGLERYDETRVQDHLLSVAALDRLWQRLAALSGKARNCLPGLEQGRGEILPAGLSIYRELLAQLGLDSLRVSDGGLLEGILLAAWRDAGNGLAERCQNAL